MNAFSRRPVKIIISKITYFSDCFDKRIVSLVEGQGPSTINDSTVDVGSKVYLRKIKKNIPLETILLSPDFFIFEFHTL